MQINKGKIKAFSIAVLFHTVLLAIFLFISFKNPDPPMFADNAGVEVNIGFSDEGMGDVQPDDQSDIQAQTPVQETPQPASTEEEVITQEVEEAPVIKETKKVEKKKVEPKKTVEPKKEQPKEVVKEKPKEEPKKIPERTANTNAMYKGKKKGTGGNEGETGKPGDQGDPNGSLYSKNHGKGNGTGDHGDGDGKDGDGGNGSGKGISFNLSGRKMRQKPSISDDSQDVGKVVVSIVVDKDGNVIKATPGSRGSTTSSANLFKKAQQAAMNAKFSRNDESEEEQTGTITFDFQLR